MQVVWASGRIDAKLAAVACRPDRRGTAAPHVGFEIAEDRELVPIAAFWQALSCVTSMTRTDEHRPELERVVNPIGVGDGDLDALNDALRECLGMLLFTQSSADSRLCSWSSAALGCFRQVFRPRIDAHLPCRLPELPIESREHDLRADGLLPSERRRELHSVIASQRVIPGERLGSRNERFSDWDPRKVLPLSYEGPLSVSCLPLGQEAAAHRFRERRPNLGAAHHGRRDDLGRGRQLDRLF